MRLYVLTLTTYICIYHTCPCVYAEEGDYNYDNQGNDWYGLSLCPNRNRQSPRTLPSRHDLPFAPAGSASFNLEQKLITEISPLDDNPRAFVVSPNISLMFEGRLLHSNSFHFHSKGEHVWESVHPDLEFHWIFAHPNGGEFVVLGVGFVVGEHTDSTLRKLITIMEHFAYNTPLQRQPALSLTRYARPKTLLIHYDGSLTTPPCDEIVQWNLRDELLSVTEEDLSKIQSMILNDGAFNHRDVQDAYNDRPIYKNRAGRYVSGSCMSLFEIIDTFDKPGHMKRRRLSHMHT